MIHYHGLPITPQTAALAAVKGGHAFVSYRYPDQLAMVLENCQTFSVDNGAFSAWKSGEPVTDWTGYYEWIAELHRYPSFDFAVIPDVINGTEEENDKLMWEFPWKNNGIGAPVFHLHESLDRLQRILNAKFRVICIGSSGEFDLGSAGWWNRMAEVFNLICDKNGRPTVKVHGLRMLNPEIFTQFPFYSCDSTNIAQNVGIDSAWKGTYTPPTKEVRALVMRERIESQQSPIFWEKQKTQMNLLI